MVSQKDSPPNPNMIQHQFLISDSFTAHSEYGSQNFNAYGSDLRGNNSFPQSLGLLPSIESDGERISTSINLFQAPSQGSEISHTRHLMDLLGAASDTNQTQPLSLSLGSQMFLPEVQYRDRAFDSGYAAAHSYLDPGEARETCDSNVDQVNYQYSLTGSGFASSSASTRYSASYGAVPFVMLIGSSRYLKPTQGLLHEVVSVCNDAVDIRNEKYVAKLLGNVGGSGAPGVSSEIKAELCNSGILQLEKNELQVRIAKLIGLLEEVERTYEKYYHQMEEVVCSFEEMAGLGAAKLYTSQALQAMSRHFCSLGDAIVSQINVIRKKLSQDSPKLSAGLSQLTLFDREGRSNRMSLQQMGFIQSQRQSWRPIRGLPETSVAILRSWLFEHFLHPYPNDSEKLMLASQTGLTRNQISNWFINARVRLWKPMIEEMYKEEFADSSEDSNPFLGTDSMTREDVTENLED